MEQPMALQRTRRSSARSRRVDDAGGPLHRVLQVAPSRRARPARACSIVVDCAHGAAYHVAPHVFHELGADVDRASASSPTASTSTTASAPPHPQRSAQQVREQQADLGIALDGDGDRLLMVDARGPPLRRRPAALRDRDGTARGKGKVAGVVGTLMTNLALREGACARCGIALRRAPRSATATCSR